MTDYSLASRTMAFDITRKIWSTDILDAAGIATDRLGILAPAGTAVGKLSTSVAMELGLREGTLIALGGHDQPCGALGAGVIDTGDVFDSAGTYECLTAVSETPRNHTKALAYNLNSYCHVVPNRYVTLAFFPAGMVVQWFAEQFDDRNVTGTSETERRFAALAERAGKSCLGPTGICFTPHFVGSCTPHWDSRATGTISGLTARTTKYDLFKAIFEGIACELAINVEVLEAVVGTFDGMRIGGGNARIPFSLQLRASITAKNLAVLKGSEAVCQGAAMLAGIAAGVYRDAKDAVQRTVKVQEICKPDPATCSAYAGQVRMYRLLYPALKSVWATNNTKERSK